MPAFSSSLLKQFQQILVLYLRFDSAFKQRLKAFFILAKKRKTLKLFWMIVFCLTMAAFAFARDDNERSKQCSKNLGDLLRNTTVFGISSWGEKWIEYHAKDGVALLSYMGGTQVKAGTWDNPSCLVICYRYPDGSGWCPQWREVEGGWVNVRPDSGEIVHQIYAIEDGDVMGLANLMDSGDVNILDGY